MTRNSPLLDGLLTEVKQQVLAAIFLFPDRSWYLHELARHLKIPVSSVQHQLGVFVAAHLLTRRKDGNRVYYQADRSCPIFLPLAEILWKTAGLADVVRDALKPLAAKISVAFIYGSVGSGEERASSDVDLMIIGRAALSEIADVLRPAEEKVEREINATVYTVQEFLKKVKEGHHFLTSVLDKELLFIHGTADDLAKLIERPASQTAQDKPGGSSRPARRRRTRP
jgi:DNA-binding transcriptional ArsR family regulator